jgi:hypothetical protein
MTLNARRVSVGIAAIRLDSADADSRADKSIAITNAGAAAVDLGGSDVTSGAGYSLAAGATITLDLGSSEQLFAIAASGTVDVHVIETGI